MFGANGDLVGFRPNHLPFFPLLFVGDESSLFEDVVEGDVDNDVVAGVDVADHLHTATGDVLRVQQCSSCFAAPAL